MLKLEDVFSVGEAGEKWGVSPITLKHACSGQKGLPPRFKEGEFRKSGKVWLITRQGMERLYGKPIED